MSVSQAEATRTLTRQGPCGTHVDSAAVDQLLCRRCYPRGHPDTSVSGTDHRPSANVLVLWFPVVTVSTPVGRDGWLRHVRTCWTI